MKIDRIKNEIIVHVLNYLDSEESDKRINELSLAIDKLKVYAKDYRLKLKPKLDPGNISDALKSFILNKDGYKTNIPKLYNLLYFERKQKAD